MGRQTRAVKTKAAAGRKRNSPADVSREKRRQVLRGAYERKRDRAAQRDREQTRIGRDIGDLPPVQDRALKNECRESLQLFCESYFPERFKLAWSDDHLRAIRKIEAAVRDGDLFAFAMPRGSGKTTLVEVSCMWAILYGFRQFIALIGSDAESAQELLASIKIELETNELLIGDFPEGCYPIACLQGIAHRCRGQLYQNKPTYIGWQKKKLIMPTIPGSAASGAVVKVAGITGRIRGMKYARPDGCSVRPDYFVVDDGQTDESANSRSQCAGRERVVAGAILGLAGPGRKIAGVIPCTVIARGDMADRLLDRKLHPEYQGERMRLVYDWPTRQDLWDRYAEIRAEELANDRGIVKATDFYRRHRKLMDAGSRVGWPARHNPDEISALQHAVNLKLNDPAAFEAEYQNDPLDPAEDAELLTIEQIAAKINGYKRSEVPQDASHVTAFVDVQGQLLYWLVAGWADNFTGYVLDYGTWPDQQQRYFTLAAARHTLELRYKGTGVEGRIFAGLRDLIDELLRRRWRRDDRAELAIERLLIDANWEKSTDVVYQFVRQSPHTAILLPTHGRGVRAKDKPMSQWAKRPGEIAGLNWRIRRTTATRAAVRHGIYNTNFWKSFVHARLAVQLGDSGCLSLFKAEAKTEHRMLAEHCRSEKRVRVEAEGHRADEWTEIPGLDNHGLDCLVGAAVAASIQGCTLQEHAATKPRRSHRRNVRYFD